MLFCQKPLPNKQANLPVTIFTNNILNRNGYLVFIYQYLKRLSNGWFVFFMIQTNAHKDLYLLPVQVAFFSKTYDHVLELQ